MYIAFLNRIFFCWNFFMAWLTSFSTFLLSMVGWFCLMNAFQSITDYAGWLGDKPFFKYTHSHTLVCIYHSLSLSLSPNLSPLSHTLSPKNPHIHIFI